MRQGVPNLIINDILMYDAYQTLGYEIMTNEAWLYAQIGNVHPDSASGRGTMRPSLWYCLHSCSANWGTAGLSGAMQEIETNAKILKALFPYFHPSGWTSIVIAADTDTYSNIVLLSESFWSWEFDNPRSSAEWNGNLDVNSCLRQGHTTRRTPCELQFDTARCRWPSGPNKFDVLPVHLGKRMLISEIS